MRRIITRKAKPEYVRPIDWANGLTGGLEGLYIALPSGIFNLVANEYISNPASAATNSPTTDGYMRDFDGAVLDYDVIPSADRRYHTIGGIYQIDTLTTDDRMAALGSSSTNTPISALGTDTSATSKVRLFYRNDGSSNSSALSVEEAGVGPTFTFSGCCADTNQKIKLNNAVVVTDTTTSGALTVDRIAFGGLQRATPAVQLDCKVSMVWLYDRDLSNEELTKLHINPWQLLQPITRSFGVKIPAVVAGLPSGTHSLLGVGI
jgi:hypothetical protein